MNIRMIAMERGKINLLESVTLFKSLELTFNIIMYLADDTHSHLSLKIIQDVYPFFHS